MNVLRRWPGLVLAVLVCEGTGLFASQWKPGAWYAALAKPAWNPPNGVFAPAWILLYALMGGAAWLVFRSPESPRRRAALGVFLLQLGLNAAWSWLFFGRHELGASVAEIALLWAAILATILAFRPVSRAAAWLLAPYLAWVTFAAALTWAVWRLNGGPEPTPPPASKNAGGWEEIAVGTDAVFSGLHFVDAKTGWIVGESPFVAGGVAGRTEDGGKTWQFVTGVTHGGPTFGLSAVHGFDRMRACAVGEGAYTTFDGGLSWQRARAFRKVASHLAALDFLTESEGWAAGGSGVLHTTDGGLNWLEVDGADSIARKVNAKVVHFTDAKTGWIAGQHGVLLSTRDGGATWTNVPFPAPADGPAPYFFGGTWTDAAHGWLVGDHGTVLRTEDGGGTWTRVDAGSPGVFFTAIAFAGADGWIVGFVPDAARSAVVRTRDGGATWAVERMLEGEELRALQVLDARTAWTVGDRVRTEPQRLLRRALSPAR